MPREYYCIKYIIRQLYLLKQQGFPSDRRQTLLFKQIQLPITDLDLYNRPIVACRLHDKSSVYYNIGMPLFVCYPHKITLSNFMWVTRSMPERGSEHSGGLRFLGFGSVKNYFFGFFTQEQSAMQIQQNLHALAMHLSLTL